MPNEDDPGFFERLHDHLRDFLCNDIIIGVDFNLVVDMGIDKKGGLAKTHTEAVKVIKDHMAELCLVAFKPRRLQIHLALPKARNPLPIRFLSCKSEPY